MVDKTNSADAEVYISPQRECSDDSYTSQLNGSPLILGCAIVVSLTCLIGVFWALKRMSRQIAAPCEGCTYIYFSQPALQTIPIFLGQASCYPLWKLDSYISRRLGRARPILDISKGNSPQELTGASIWWWVSPAPFDFVSCIFCNAALTMTYGGTVQMLRNILVVVVALTRVIVSRRCLKMHEVLGISLVLTGLTLCCFSAIHQPDLRVSAPEHAWRGIIFAIVGNTVYAVQILWEEYLFMKADVHPATALGVEGLASIYVNLCLLPIVHEAGFSNVWKGLYQISHTPLLLGGMFALWAAALGLTASSFLITHIACPVVRLSLYAARSPLLFVFEHVMMWRSLNFIDGLSLGTFVLGFCFNTLLIDGDVFACCCTALADDSSRHHLAAHDEPSDMLDDPKTDRRSTTVAGAPDKESHSTSSEEPDKVTIDIVTTPTASELLIFDDATGPPTPLNVQESSSGSASRSKRPMRRDKSWTSEDDRFRELIAVRSLRHSSDSTQRIKSGNDGVLRSSSSMGPRSRRSSAESSCYRKRGGRRSSWTLERSLSRVVSLTPQPPEADHARAARGILAGTESPLPPLRVIEELLP